MDEGEWECIGFVAGPMVSLDPMRRADWFVYRGFALWIVRLRWVAGDRIDGIVAD